MLGRGFLQPYLPHLYLGVALSRLGDCRAALRELEESERQGVVSGRERELNLLLARREKCEESSEEAARVEREATASLAEARELMAEVTALSSEAGVGLQGSTASASLQDLLRVAESYLAEATSLLDTHRGTTRSEPLERALGLTVAATDELKLARRDALALGQQLAGELAERRRLDKAAERLPLLLDEARAAMQETEFLAPYPRSVRRGRADLRGLLEESERNQVDSDARYLEGLVARLATSIAGLREIAAPPGPLLMSAATAFFAGDYESTRDVLGAAELSGRRQAAHGHLLYAAASFRLYLREGERDEALP